MPKICTLCGKEFPYTIKINGKTRNLGSRKYCLDCSPFGSHNTRKISLKILHVEDGYKHCTKCNKVKLISEFYKQSKTNKSWCKECTRKYQSKKLKERQSKLKRKAVQYKGGKCSVCGYSRCIAALEFHHINPEEKEYSLSRVPGGHSFTNEVKKELDKCDLVCSNCHRELHYKLNNQ